LPTLWLPGRNLPQNTQIGTEKICGNLCILWQKII
jgi:hypothetical protein